MPNPKWSVFFFVPRFSLSSYTRLSCENPHWHFFPGVETLLRLCSNWAVVLFTAQKWQFPSPQRQCWTMKVYESQFLWGTLMPGSKRSNGSKGVFWAVGGRQISLFEKIASFKRFCKIREKSRNSSQTCLMKMPIQWAQGKLLVCWIKLCNSLTSLSKCMSR